MTAVVDILKITLLKMKNPKKKTRIIQWEKKKEK